MLKIPAILLVIPCLATCTAPETTGAAQVSPNADQAWQSLHPKASPTAPLRDDWWRNFGDTALNQLMLRVLENNYDLAAASARVQAVAAQARVVAGARMPQANAGLDLNRGRQNFIGLPIPGAPTVFPVSSNRFNLGFNISWELDLWGRLEANENAAIATYEASEAEFAAIRLSLAGQTTKAWFAHKEALQQLENSQAQIQNAENLLAHARLRFENGGSADALHQAEANFQLLRAAYPLAKHQEQLWQRQLHTLLGQYTESSTAPEVGMACPSLEPIPAGLPAQLVERRPDLAQAEAELRAARARSRAAEASLYPTLGLTGSSGTSSTALGDLLDGHFKVWNLGASLTAPLFHGGALKAQAEASENLARAAYLQFAQQVLRALAEVENALDNEAQIEARTKELKEQIQTLENRVFAAEERYRNGLEDASQVYTVRGELLRSQSSLWAVELLLLSNRIDLYLALGGGFQNSYKS